MNQKNIAIAATVLAATVLTVVFTTTPLAYADSSETETEQNLGQGNIGSGESNNDNCGADFINGESVPHITTISAAPPRGNEVLCSGSPSGPPPPSPQP